jgi:hypothetical protein
MAPLLVAAGAGIGTAKPAAQGLEKYSDVVCRLEKYSGVGFRIFTAQKILLGQYF